MNYVKAFESHRLTDIKILYHAASQVVNYISSNKFTLMAFGKLLGFGLHCHTDDVIKP